MEAKKRSPVEANEQRAKSSVISATMMQRQIGIVLRRVAKDGEHIVIERGGFPIVVLIPLTDYRELMKRK